LLLSASGCIPVTESPASAERTGNEAVNEIVVAEDADNETLNETLDDNEAVSEIVVGEDADNETLNETPDDGEPVITEPAGETENGTNGVCVADMTDWQLFESFHKYADHSIRLLLPQALWPLPVVTGDRDLL